MQEFALGQILVDRVTGVKGTAVSECRYLNGCIQYQLQPAGVQETGEPLKNTWVDSDQLELAEEESVGHRSSGTGGPASHPPPLPTPR